VIALTLKDEFDPAYPQLPIPRLLAEGAFDPQAPASVGQTAFAGAFVDTGSPYVIVPHKVHQSGLLRYYDDHGPQPFRTAGMLGAPILQHMVDVGVRFLTRQPVYAYRPAHFIRVRAYLLDKHIRASVRVVIGLQAIKTYLSLYVGDARAYFLEPGESIQAP
jgi:hypothetical protein